MKSLYETCLQCVNWAKSGIMPSQHDAFLGSATDMEIVLFCEFVESEDVYIDMEYYVVNVGNMLVSYIAGLRVNERGLSAPENDNSDVRPDSEGESGGLRHLRSSTWSPVPLVFDASEIERSLSRVHVEKALRKWVDSNG